MRPSGLGLRLGPMELYWSGLCQQFRIQGFLGAINGEVHRYLEPSDRCTHSDVVGTDIPAVPGRKNSGCVGGETFAVKCLLPAEALLKRLQIGTVLSQLPNSSHWP